MEEIFEQFKDKDAFDAYWKEHYVPLTYEDVREAYEDFVKSADKHIFLSDYEESGNVSREDFMDKSFTGGAVRVSGWIDGSVL